MFSQNYSSKRKIVLSISLFQNKYKYSNIIGYRWNLSTYTYMMGRVTNEGVKQKMGKDREICTTIKQRNSEYLGNIMHKEHSYNLPQVILQGKLEEVYYEGGRKIFRPTKDTSHFF